jgi:gluconate 2-dehydrogenase gamma chain
MVDLDRDLADSDFAGSHLVHEPIGNQGPATETPAPSLRAYRLTTAYLFFNDDEAAFIESAIARLIPKDDQWVGAREAGVPNYITTGWRMGCWRAALPQRSLAARNTEPGIPAPLHAGRTVPNRTGHNQQGALEDPVCGNEP